MSKKPNTAPFVDPETAARMQSLREQDEFAPQPDETLTQVGSLSQENLELKQKLGEAESNYRSVCGERDKAIAQVAILKKDNNWTVGPQFTSWPDGSRQVTLKIDPDKVALWESWAQDYGTTFEEMAQRQISEALDAYAG